VAEQGSALKIMALTTLCAFPFRGPLVHLAEKVLRYLDSKVCFLCERREFFNSKFAVGGS
jgi:hypothetical protein